MSEFQDKLQVMKDGIVEDMKPEGNPALISTDLLDDNNEELTDSPFSAEGHLSEEQPAIREGSNQRNEKGFRKRKNVRDRLEAALAENRAKDAQYQQAMAYIQEQNRRLSEAQSRAEQSAHYSNVYYEQGLENEEQRVLTELEYAKESGDIKKEVELQKRLADIAAERKTQLLSKSLQRQQPQQMDYSPPVYQPQEYQQYQPQVMQEESTDEYLEDWLEDNPWADPRSSEYDEHLSREVNDLAVELNKNLKFNRQGGMIGTPEYYNSLSSLMNERYSVNTNNSNRDNNDNYYVDNRAYEVAPVTKRGSSMADRYIANNQGHNRSTRPTMSLTKDQYEIASKLGSVLSHFEGKRVSEKEAVQKYYDQNMEIMKYGKRYL